jgi:hypothetical protein
LKSKEICACATIRSSRKDFPSLKADKELKRGDYDYKANAGVTVYKWHDSKPVHLISNYHGSASSTVKRKNKDGSRVVLSCPTAVRDYNSYMIGVDKHDMLRQLYGLNRKAKKWWHRIFFGLFDMAIVNSFIVFQETTGPEINFFNYRRSLAQSLLTIGKCERADKRVKRRKFNYSVPSSVRLSNTGVHWPVFGHSKGRCEVCASEGIQSRPTSQCSQCKINLCCNTSKNCSMRYHQ